MRVSHLPNDLKTFVFPSGTESFPEITSPISPETVALYTKKTKKDRITDTAYAVVDLTADTNYTRPSEQKSLN